MAADGQSNKMAFDKGEQMKQRCVTEFLPAGKMAPTNIHWRLLNIYGDQTGVVSAVKWVHFSSDVVIAAVKQWVISTSTDF